MVKQKKQEVRIVIGNKAEEEKKKKSRVMEGRDLEYVWMKLTMGIHIWMIVRMHQWTTEIARRRNDSGWTYKCA